MNKTKPPQDWENNLIKFCDKEELWELDKDLYDKLKEKK